MVLSSKSRRVYWVDHFYYSENLEISSEDGNSGKWHYVPWNSDNMLYSLVHLSDSIEDFLMELFADRLQQTLDELD